MKGRPIPWSAEELRWVKKHKRMLRPQACAAFCKRFRRKITLGAYAALCARKGWLTGRDGRYLPGSVPANKGKKMPFNANSARTQFKKGCRSGRANALWKPVGTERVTKDGYIERKVHDGLPMQSRWRVVHLLKWEAVNGPLPKGHCLKCRDGNKANTDPANWVSISRGALPFLNGHRGHAYDQSAAALKPSILALARLRQAASAKAKRKPVAQLRANPRLRIDGQRSKVA